MDDMKLVEYAYEEVKMMFYQNNIPTKTNLFLFSYKN